MDKKTMDELVLWYQGLIYDVLDPEKYTQEEGRELVNEGFDTFMATWMQDIQDQLPQETRDELCAEYFCPDMDVEERMTWYQAICEAMETYRTAPLEDVLQDLLDGTIDNLYTWADYIFLSLSKDAQAELNSFYANEIAQYVEEMGMTPEPSNKLEKKEPEKKTYRNFELN